MNNLPHLVESGKVVAPEGAQTRKDKEKGEKVSLRLRCLSSFNQGKPRAIRMYTTITTLSAIRKAHGS